MNDADLRTAFQVIRDSSSVGCHPLLNQLELLWVNERAQLAVARGNSIALEAVELLLNSHRQEPAADLRRIA